MGTLQDVNNNEQFSLNKKAPNLRINKVFTLISKKVSGHDAATITNALFVTF